MQEKGKVDSRHTELRDLNSASSYKMLKLICLELIFPWMLQTDLRDVLVPALYMKE